MRRVFTLTCSRVCRCILLGLVLFTCLCSLSSTLPILGATTPSEPASEIWIESSLNVTLTASEDQPTDHEEATEWVEITSLYKHTRLIFYVAMDQTPLNISVHVTLGSWERHVFLTPTNCSFRTWIDVDFNSTWDYLMDALLNLPLRVETSLATEEDNVQGWIGRIKLRSFEVSSLIGRSQEIPLCPQNQSQVLGKSVTWVDYSLKTEGLIYLPRNQYGLVITLDVEVQWTGAEVRPLPPLLTVHFANQSWQNETSMNSSAFVSFHGELPVSQSDQEELLTILFQMNHIKGEYVNVCMRVFVTVEELTLMNSSPVSSSHPLDIVESVITPTLVLSIAAMSLGLWGSKRSHYRKWHPKHEDVEEEVLRQVREF